MALPEIMVVTEKGVQHHTASTLIDIIYTPLSVVAIMASKHNKSGQSLESFESSLEQLSSIIDELETDNISLESALKSFEKGIKLTSEAQQVLAKAEQKVSVLLNK